MARRARWGICGEQMAVTLAVWMCTLPAVFLMVAPLWGLKVAGVVSLVVLAVLSVICAGVCSWKVGMGAGTGMNGKEKTS